MIADPGVIHHPLASMGRLTAFLIQEMGCVVTFFFRGFFSIFSLPLQVKKMIHQVYFIGTKSMFVICLTATFTGMVLGLQGYYTLVKFGSEGLLGAAVALSLLREPGPVLTAIMVIGRAGSAMAAEIGIMRISEQIDALETMDINPIRFLVSPRIAAAVVSFPLLTALFDVVGIFGGYLTGSCFRWGLSAWRQKDWQRKEARKYLTKAVGILVSFPRNFRLRSRNRNDAERVRQFRRSLFLNLSQQGIWTERYEMSFHFSVKKTFRTILLLSTSFLLFSTSLFAAQFKVIEVYDGDTIRAEGHGTEIRVRLAGIDAPEIHRDVREKGQPYGQEAREYLESMILNKPCLSG